MKISIITITHNRLYYNYHCFKKLKELAGCEYQHIIVDNGSTDGTEKWLVEEGYDPYLNKKNEGISRAIRQIVGRIPKDTDVVIKFDPDCELIQPDTIKILAELTMKYPKMMMAPKTLGIGNKPIVVGDIKLGDYTFEHNRGIGGIFRPHTYKDFMQKMKDVEILKDHYINEYFEAKGYKIGYLKEIQVNHFETTWGQWDRYGGADKQYGQYKY